MRYSPLCGECDANPAAPQKQTGLLGISSDLRARNLHTRPANASSKEPPARIFSFSLQANVIALTRDPWLTVNLTKIMASMKMATLTTAIDTTNTAKSST